jgi:hypothetical protein
MRQTNDQQAATQTLRAQAGPYRVTLDTEGWPKITGRHGRIEHHDETTLAVCSQAMRKLSPLVALGARRHQIGDAEYRLLFEPGLLGKVAQAIKARRRRAGGRAPEDMAHIRELSPIGRKIEMSALHRATTANQEARRGPGQCRRTPRL